MNIEISSFLSFGLRAFGTINSTLSIEMKIFLLLNLLVNPSFGEKQICQLMSDGQEQVRSNLQ